MTVNVGSSDRFLLLIFLDSFTRKCIFDHLPPNSPVALLAPLPLSLFQLAPLCFHVFPHPFGDPMKFNLGCLHEHEWGPVTSSSASQCQTFLVLRREQKDRDQLFLFSVFPFFVSLSILAWGLEFVPEKHGHENDPDF